MKILIVAPVIYPFQSPRSFRATELAKELAKEHEVTVMSNTIGADYSEFQNKYNLKVKPFKKLNFVKKHSYFKERYSFFNKILIRLFRRCLYFPNIEFLWKVPSSLKRETNYDLLISIGAPHSIHWGCRKAISKNPSLCKKWIADCGDPYMFNKFENPPLYFANLEKQFMQKADYITVPIDEAKNAYYPEFRNKIHVIPQGFNFEDINLFEGEIENEVPTFAYAGALYPGLRDPRKFLDFLCTINKDFKFIVYTKSTSLFEPYFARLGKKLIVNDYIERSQLLYELSKVDFLVNFENDTNTQSPSKLIDYALIKRPILSFNPNYSQEDIILEFLERNYKNKTKVDISKYDIKIVDKNFLKLVDENQH